MPKNGRDSTTCKKKNPTIGKNTAIILYRQINKWIDEKVKYVQIFDIRKHAILILFSIPAKESCHKRDE